MLCCSDLCLLAISLGRKINWEQPLPCCDLVLVQLRNPQLFKSHWPALVLLNLSHKLGLDPSAVIHPNSTLLSRISGSEIFRNHLLACTIFFPKLDIVETTTHPWQHRVPLGQAAHLVPSSHPLKCAKCRCWGEPAHLCARLSAPATAELCLCAILGFKHSLHTGASHLQTWKTVTNPDPSFWWLHPVLNLVILAKHDFINVSSFRLKAFFCSSHVFLSLSLARNDLHVCLLWATFIWVIQQPSTHNHITANLELESLGVNIMLLSRWEWGAIFCHWVSGKTDFC